VVELLAKLEELVKVIQRRGIDFADFLAKRDSAGRLPIYWIVVDGEDHFKMDAAERDEFLREQNLLVEDEEMAKVQSEDKKSGNGNGEEMRRLQKNQELHEVKELERLFAQLEQHGLSIDDYFLTQEESVTGEKLLTKYALVNEQQTVDVAGVGQVLPQILGMGKTGMEIKRFKGLGR